MSKKEKGAKATLKIRHDIDTAKLLCFIYSAQTVDFDEVCDLMIRNQGVTEREAVCYLNGVRKALDAIIDKAIEWGAIERVTIGEA